LNLKKVFYTIASKKINKMFPKYRPIKPVSDYVKYRLHVYEYYKEHILNKDAVMKNYKIHCCDSSEYDEFLSQRSRQYLFLRNIKSYLRECYEERLDTLYRRVYSPENVSKLLAEGLEVDEIFQHLDEEIKYVKL